MLKPIMQNYETLTITCSDHYSLNGRFYAAQGTQQALPVLICPATGITQQFYHHFASWLAEQGYAVLVFDFRGIGESLHEPLKSRKPASCNGGN